MITNLTPEDVRRLQILNDYVAQSIDAVQRLNPILQQRGLWHTGYAPVGFGVSPWTAQSMVDPWRTAYNPFVATMPGLGLQQTLPLGTIPGLSHTAAYAPAMAAIPELLQGSMVPGVQPFGVQPFGVQSLGGQPFVHPALRQQVGLGAIPGFGGMMHTPFDPLSTLGAISPLYGNPLVEAAIRADVYRRAIYGF
ncbi:MAG: hypothetical protein HYY06_06730 [Deltaproteobacteria bacterium]|nr:hypothetical protein [Deltaproteobacteria bacterium]